MRMELHTLFSQFVQTMEKKNMSSKLKMVSFIILKNFKNANINAILAKTTMLDLQVNAFFQMMMYGSTLISILTHKQEKWLSTRPQYSSMASGLTANGTKVEYINFKFTRCNHILICKYTPANEKFLHTYHKINDSIFPKF